MGKSILLDVSHKYSLTTYRHEVEESRTILSFSLLQRSLFKTQSVVSGKELSFSTNTTHVVPFIDICKKYFERFDTETPGT